MGYKIGFILSPLFKDVQVMEIGESIPQCSFKRKKKSQNDYYLWKTKAKVK